MQICSSSIYFLKHNILLNNNNLHQIEGAFIEAMWSVRNLDISNNPLVYLRKNSFRKKTSGIREISLQNTSLEYIHPMAFENLRDLRYLDLSCNNLHFLDVNLFSYNLNNLRLLYLDNNHLRNIHSVFTRAKRLEELHLDSNDLEILGEDLNNFSYLLKLTLDYNSITSLDSYNFRNLTLLYKLSIQFNKLCTLEEDCFSELTALRELYLSNNFITHLNGSLKNLEKLELLALDGNPLTRLDKEDFANVKSLKYLMLNSTGLKTFDGHLNQLIGLKYLDMRNNKINTIEIIPNLTSLQTIKLEGNPWVCDCDLKLMLQRIPHLISNIICYLPETVKGKPLRHIMNTATKWIVDCPPNCACFCIENNLGKNVYVNCSERNLTMPPSTLPEDTAILDLSKNFLTKLTNDTCISFHNLSILNVEDNSISYVDKCVARDVKTIKFARNMLSSPEFLSEEKTLKAVTLSGNSWICNCGTLKFRIWLISHKDKVLDIAETICGSQKGQEHLNSQTIYTLTEQDLCPAKIAVIILVVLGVLCFLLFLTCLKILYTRYNVNAKIWLYSKGFTCFKEEDISQDKRFDAFISYSSCDESFVIKFIVPGLEEEEPHFSLCLHYRHFAPGEYIHDNILSAIQCSSRTIIILSKNFLMSEWCCLEFRAAYVKLLQDKVNRIVIIKYGDLPPLSEIDPAIRVHLESTTYLTWGEKSFWQKLRYSMPKNRASQNPNRCSYGDLILT